MVEISKPLFDQACSHLECHVLMHPWNESCMGSIPHIIFNSLIGSAKFYTTVYLFQILMRYKNLRRKKEWFKLGEYYIRSWIFGSAVNVALIILSCSSRKALGGKLNYYMYALIPCTLSGVFIFLEPPSRRGLIINLFSSLLLQFWIRALDKAGIISMTKTKQTALFMLGNAVLLYLMRLEGDKKQRTPLFWLFTPEKVKLQTNEDKNPCQHNGSCLKYILKGAATYFGIGATFTLARIIIPNISSPIRALTSIQRKHFNMGLFFSSYIGIYRAVICFLCRKRGIDSALYALPAGCLAGLSLLFSPNLGFATASVTSALKLYSTILYEKKVLTTNIPLPELLYCIAQGILFNAYFMHPETCPSYIINLMERDETNDEQSSSGSNNGFIPVISDYFYRLKERRRLFMF